MSSGEIVGLIYMGVGIVLYLILAKLAHIELLALVKRMCNMFERDEY